jgi:hypothetical protein
MNTMNLPGGKVRLARKADNLTAISEPIYMGASTSRKSVGLHGLLQEYRYLFLPTISMDKYWMTDNTMGG